MSNLYFCTLFDHRYLPRGLVLYKTLKAHSPDAILHVLCLSTECHEKLTELVLPDVVLTRLTEVEAFDKELVAIKKSRSWVEYIFTLSPCWPLYLFKKYADIDLLTLVDTDTAFFSDPRPALEHMKTTSVGITGHRFPKRLKRLEKFGLYNVGFQSFCRDEVGLSCLSWWRERCLEWCGDHIDGDRYADQKYLNKWPELFAAKEFPHRGLNVGPWNVDSSAFTLKNGQVFSDDDPLVFFHFQGIEKISQDWWDVGLIKTNSQMTKVLRKNIFLPYIKLLNEETEKTSVFSAQRLRLNRWKWLLSYTQKRIAIFLHKKSLIKYRN